MLKMPEVRSHHTVKTDKAEVSAKLVALRTEIVRRAVEQKIAGITLPEQVEVTQISPVEDLGKTVEDWTYTYTAAQTWERFIEAYDIGERIIGIIGVRILSPNPYTIVVRFGLGWPLTFIKGWFHIESGHGEPQVMVVFEQPIIFNKGDKATIELYGRAGATGVTERIEFVGLAARKKGTLVS